ncbi:growth hormone receptor isoform X3 [Hemicordylus capensis]|uniref:growth hormone receptor isoform X3 n=1 Tax=Hemicordylus capensis TaxID=884348 RepID=UPI0023027C89|nr:growth hormone receptor isoform X3 [Hemicordylus capensis]
MHGGESAASRQGRRQTRLSARRGQSRCCIQRYGSPTVAVYFGTGVCERFFFYERGDWIGLKRGGDVQTGRICSVAYKPSQCIALKKKGIPDPPIALNWTLLNTSPTAVYMDIEVTWAAPPLADVKTGWIPLKYQLQYKEVSETTWNQLEPELLTTKHQLYSLKTCHDYEIRVRAAQNTSEIYGEFSEVLHVSFGAVGLLPCGEAPAGGPQIIKCRSPEMETFSCYWTTGDFPHLTAPGTIQLQFLKRHSVWKECPDYVTAGENSCYFNETYTSVWVPYCLKLVSGNQLYDEKCVRVEDIVMPDPPVDLNWTLMNTSPSGVYKDILVTWKPPPSADVRNGWVTLKYQLQYKEVNETRWNELKSWISVTKLPLYSLRTCHDYEIRVRASRSASETYGEFSDILYVPFGGAGLVPCEEESQVPWPWSLVMSFGILGLMVMLSLILFSKQQKIKILILPPVPVPKIKGIDPDLFKKGKLDEVNSILASHDSYMPQLYGDDSWVEFIELDIDEAEERTEGSDTDRLLGNDHLKSHSCLGMRDDDSGRASCCEPDIPETDFSASDTCDGISDIDPSKKANDKEEDLLCLDPKDNEKSLLGLDGAATQPPADHPAEDKQPKAHLSRSLETAGPPVQAQLSNQSSVANIDFYTQVSDITPGGSVVLFPGQKSKMGRIQGSTRKEPAAQCQTNFAMDSAYFCELDVKKCVTVMPREEAEPEVQEKSFPEGAYFATECFTTSAVNPTTAPAEEKPEASEMPVADYTSIHIVQSPQGLVLSATALPLPDKEFMASCGYVSADQLNKMLP